MPLPCLLETAQRRPVRRPARWRGVVGHRVRQGRYYYRHPVNVRLHPEEPLVALLGLVHLRIAFALLVLGRAGRGDDGGVDDAALPEQQAPCAPECLLTAAGMSSARSLASSRCRKFRMVVSSGIASFKLRREARSEAISYSASSIAGSLSANQFCIRCTRSIDASGYGLRPRPPPPGSAVDQVQHLPRHHLFHLLEEYLAPRLLCACRRTSVRPQNLSGSSRKFLSHPSTHDGMIGGLVPDGMGASSLSHDAARRR